MKRKGRTQREGVIKKLVSAERFKVLPLLSSYILNFIVGKGMGRGDELGQKLFAKGLHFIKSDQ